MLIFARHKFSQQIFPFEMEVAVRNATQSDLSSVLEMAKSVGRYICIEELQTFMRIDPECLFMAESSENTIVGTCCATILAPDLGFMGLYIVTPDNRGRGIGLRLWKTAKKHLGDRNIGLRGDEINFKVYSEKDNFHFVEDYRILYFECFGDSLPTSISELPPQIEVVTFLEGKLVDSLNGKAEVPGKSPNEKYQTTKLDDNPNYFCSNSLNRNDEGTIFINVDKDPLVTTKEDKVNLEEPVKTCDLSLEPVKKDEFEESVCGHFCDNNRSTDKTNLPQNKNQDSISSVYHGVSYAETILSEVVAYDKSLHRRDRSLVLRETFSWPSCLSKVAMGANGKVVGFACLRPVVTGHWLLSPFYADSEAVAEVLIFNLLLAFDFSVAPRGIQIRIPDKNTTCKNLIERFGFKKSTEDIQIRTGFTKKCAGLDVSKVYSFHSTVFCSE
ncbi:n-acetyltransferase domain-containing protein [Caerostris darwini]|uniref:N-acetyltransferase domain-containing protein n=1 Tax=Caerostris darwini TaxID=1538125 RepID=A0AAV4S1Z4_9ARAC|nr:n-acetyltransferase domain-containing protein [Caerostris darwini]